MNKPIGIIGGGQLGRMLALAGYRMGYKFLFLDAKPDACAGQVGELIVADYHDQRALAEMAGRCRVLTYDFENVAVAELRNIESQIAIQPPLGALAAAQDRAREKEIFQQLGISTVPYRLVDTRADLEAAVTALGLPLVVKVRRLGYDGKGQFRVLRSEDVEAAWKALGKQALIAEKFIEFDRELSIIAVRGQNGDKRSYPLSVNFHDNGILASTVAPAPQVSDAVCKRATQWSGALLDHFGYVGVLALELFQVGDELLANEFAPRVHNSGHWTMDGADTCQFENHLRAITGLPLGSTRAQGHTAMVNWIGKMPSPAGVLQCDTIRWHEYGKTVRPGRKVGHLNLRANDYTSLQQQLGQFIEGLADAFSQTI